MLYQLNFDKIEKKIHPINYIELTICFSSISRLRGPFFMVTTPYFSHAHVRDRTMAVDRDYDVEH